MQTVHDTEFRPRLAPTFFRAIAAVLVSCCACSFQSNTQRNIGGQLVDGRRISPEAYAQFARASYAEHTHRLGEAEKGYWKALQLDPKSPALWSRLGAIRCALNQDNGSSEFEQAHQLAPLFAPAALRHSSCLELRGEWEKATSLAEHAVQLAPDSETANKSWARLLRHGGKTEKSALVALAFSLRHPEIRPSPTAGEERHSMFSPNFAGETKPIGSRARRMAPSAIAPALTALNQGDPELARERITPLLRASPADPNCLIVALLVAERLQDLKWLSKLLRSSKASSSPSRETAQQLAKLLHRRLGTRASREWFQAYRFLVSGSGATPTP